MQTKHLFIINPVAGKKDRTEIITSAIQRHVTSEPYEICVTSCPGDATEIAKRHLDSAPDDVFTRVYACGGDGTLSEVVLGMYQSRNKNAAIGVVPIGSGNDFIKYYDAIPPEKFRSLSDMTVGRTELIDLLLIRDSVTGSERVSINIVSTGFDAAVCKGMVKYKRLPLVNGSAAYNLSLAKCLLTERKHNYRVVADGKQVQDIDENYLFVIAANGCYYGGGFKASPISNIQDGLLDLIRIKTVPVSSFLSLVGKFRQGLHLEQMKDVTTHSLCSSVQIIAPEAVDTNIDGEIVPMHDPVISIVPKAINLILPEA